MAVTSSDLGHSLFIRVVKTLELVLREALTFLQHQAHIDTKSLDLPKMLVFLKTNKAMRDSLFSTSTKFPPSFVTNNLGEIAAARNREAHSEMSSPVKNVYRCVQSMHNLVQILRNPPKNIGFVFDSLTKICDVLEAVMSMDRGVLTGKEKVTFNLKTLFAKKVDAFPSRIVLSTTRLFGRAEELQSIISVVKNQSNSTGFGVSRLLLYGQPGVGKTALAREIVRCLRDEFPHQHFFQATTSESLRASCCLFMESQAYKKEKLLPHESGKEVRNYLSGICENLLLVFDDVTDPDVVLSVLPERRHCAIFTSVSVISWMKARSGLTHFFATEVKPLSTDASLALFKDVVARNSNPATKSSPPYTSEELHALGAFLESKMGNLPLAVRLTAFQCLSGKWSLEKRCLETEPPDMVRSREDWKAAGRIHVRGFYHLVKSWLEGRPRGSLATAICYGLSLLPASGVPLMYIEFLVHALCPDLGDCQAAAHELKNALTMSGLVQVTEDEVWMMHTVCQSRVHAVLNNYPQRSVVHHALREMFSVVSCHLDGNSSVITKNNIGLHWPTFGLEAAQTWLYLISHFKRSLEEKHLLEAQLEFYLLNMQIRVMVAMDTPKAMIGILEQRLLDLSSQARQQSGENSLKTANPSEIFQDPTLWMPIYGLLNYRQGQTCPADVLTLAEQSIRMSQTLAGRAKMLTSWFVQFSNALRPSSNNKPSHQPEAICCCAAPGVLRHRFARLRWHFVIFVSCFSTAW